MFETIRIFLYNNIALHRWGNHLIAALVATLFSLHVPAVWAESPLPERLDTRETAKALLAAPIVPQEAQDLANYFLDHTLPKLLADDSHLGRQMGYGESMNDTVTFDRALPLLLINRNDVLNYAITKTDLRDVVLDAVSNTNNWRKEAGELIPKRIVFLVKNEAPSESDSSSRSSITLEQSLSGAWRIIQVGAPKLSRAISFETPRKNQFLLWITDLNRHYLGEASAGDPERPAIPLITLTRLFNDQLTRGKAQAHTQFDPTSKEFIDSLMYLYQALDLPQKLRGQSGQTREPIQFR